MSRSTSSISNFSYSARMRQAQHAELHADAVGEIGAVVVEDPAVDLAVPGDQADLREQVDRADRQEADGEGGNAVALRLELDAEHVVFGLAEIHVGRFHGRASRAGGCRR